MSKSSSSSSSSSSDSPSVSEPPPNVRSAIRRLETRARAVRGVAAVGTLAAVGVGTLFPLLFNAASTLPYLIAIMPKGTTRIRSREKGSLLRGETTEDRGQRTEDRGQRRIRKQARRGP
eukprot:1195598-Prorocentrum_minimum.AAC.1